MHDLITYQPHKITTRSSYTGTTGTSARDASPDSVIFSNFSHFSSSASASVDRYSSASDVLDRDSSDMSLHLSVSARGPDLDPNNNNSSPLFRKKVEKAKDCQYRKSRSEILLRKSERKRPTSFDLNNQTINVTSYSPRLAMKGSVSSKRANMFPSPVTPSYRPASNGIQKGWSSERVALNTNGNRRHVSSGLMSSGRTLPSKWEDAERWICSPVGGDSGLRPVVQQPQRRQKSKSGPLGPTNSVYNSMYSPAVHMFDGGHIGSLLNGSPFLSRPCMARSVSVHGCSESLSQSLLRITQDGKIGCVLDASTNVSRDVSRRDMATQMSPEGSPYSSPRMRNSVSLSNSILPVVEVQQIRTSKADVRDVQVDDQVSLSKWSKKTRTRIPGRKSGSEMVDDWKRKALEVRSADWEVSEMTKNLSKVKREEAKITAWENLQKAKAEASIRKLEMKLEKKRSSSMDKIMNKLRAAQKKAQDMRGSVLYNQSERQLSRSSSQKAISLIRTPQLGSLSGCFTCHAF
ncbi:remorin family protein [Artemisia annua]|uniref:Remorin family protein n=1 Tax=Artemisia annua TaxID=35608 RepID=A0A2U1LIX8_ARTAN|nr:remorin family protein [Artemisia annua]